MVFLIFSRVSSKKADLSIDILDKTALNRWEVIARVLILSGFLPVSSQATIKTEKWIGYEEKIVIVPLLDSNLKPTDGRLELIVSYSASEVCYSIKFFNFIYDCQSLGGDSSPSAIFGVSLSELLSRESKPIPSFVEQCLKTLDPEG